MATSPTDVTVMSNVSTGEVSVSWGPPESPGGTINFYHVEITNIGTEKLYTSLYFVCYNIVTEEVTTESVTVPHGSQDSLFSVEVILAQGTYAVTVVAENNEGLGTPSQAFNISLVPG